MIFSPFSEVQFSYSFVLINNPLRAQALVNHFFLAARKIIWGTLYSLLYCQRNYTQERKKQGKTDCPFCKSIEESLLGFFSLYKARIRFCFSSPWKKKTKHKKHQALLTKWESSTNTSPITCQLIWKRRNPFQGTFFLSDIRVIELLCSSKTKAS